MALQKKNGDDLLVYYHPYCVGSQKVLMSLLQKRLCFRKSYVNVFGGQQYTERMLALNAKGGVPILVDDVMVIPGTDEILEFLEDNFANGTPRLRPLDLELRQRVDELDEDIKRINIDAVTFGTILHNDHELGLNPKVFFNDAGFLTQIGQFADNREAFIHAAMIRYPKHADILKRQLTIHDSEAQLCKHRQKFVDLILDVERVLDECEIELKSHSDRNIDHYWLCSPGVSKADVSLSLLLHRMWQLGYERKMWNKRPYVKRYFSKVQQLESFQQATNMKMGSNTVSDIVSSPYFWGAVGVGAVAGGLYLWHRNGGRPLEKLYSFFQSEGSGSSAPNSTQWQPPASSALQPNLGHKIPKPSVGAAATAAAAATGLKPPGTGTRRQ